MARRVVVVGVYRGTDLVEPMDVIQEVGRAGRKGIDEKGDAYILLPKSRWVALRERYKKSPPIISRMVAHESEGIDNLIFHVVSEVAEGNIGVAKDLVEWHEKSLAAYQSGRISISDAKEILALLEKIRAIKKDGYFYEATGLGRIASWMYMNPYDVFAWYMNFREVFEKEIEASTIAIAWAVANCRMFDTRYVSSEESGSVMAFIERCRKIGVEIFNSRAASGAAVAKLLGHKDMVTMVDDSRSDVVRMDIERVVQTLSLIGSLYAKWDKELFFDRLLIRFRYSIPDELVDLCRLKGIGAVRSSNLYAVGIKSLKDMISSRDKSILVLGGDERAIKIYEEATKGE